MAKTLTGSAYGIEIPPGDVEALRSSAGNLEQLASHIGEELRRATTERTGLSGTWGGLAAANYQKTATDLELGLRTLEAHIHEASGAIHTYASALESSKAGAREAIRIASDAESIWQELQRWADAEVAALQSAATATLGAGAAGVSALLSDIERQLQQGYDTYRSELTRAVHRAEQEMQAAKHSAHLLAGRLHQGVVKMPGTLWGLGVGLAGFYRDVKVGEYFLTLPQKWSALADYFQAEGALGDAKTVMTASEDAFTALVDAGENPDVIMSGLGTLFDAQTGVEEATQVVSDATDVVKGAFASPVTKALSWVGDTWGSSDGTLGTVASAVGDSAEVAGKAVPFLGLLALPQDVKMVVDPGQSGGWGVGDRVAGGLGGAAAIGLVAVQFIPGVDVAVDIGLGVVAIGAGVYEGVDWAAHHWSTIEHVAGTVANAAGTAANDAVHAGEAVVGADIHAVTEVAHVGGEVVGAAAGAAGQVAGAVGAGVGTAFHDAGSVVKDLNPFSWNL